MDFDNVFSTTDLYGMMAKSFFKREIKKSVEGLDEEFRLSHLNLMKEVIDECINELGGKI